jgi:uncharacterized protein (TIGR02246 family)
MFGSEDKMEPTTTERRDFIPYPTNRVVGTIADAKDARAAINELLQAGFDQDNIDILHGEADLHRLDPTGDEHGFLAQFQRTLIRIGGPVEESKHLRHHVEDVRAGRFVIMVLAKERDQRTIAADILNAHGAEFVGFYGRWAWQGLTADVGVSRAGAGADDQGATQPEQIPALFAAAWNRRDPDALASLFEDDAEFVNVTGLWWHDRPSIRKAHAYGLERIFNESTLAIEETRVKRLSDDVVVVHARMTLSGQSPIGKIKRPGSRTTVFSFVARRVGERWLCASAHNTDVVPHMETNVVDADGAFRAANYESGKVS